MVFVLGNLTGMADFQVLPPGLNQMPFKADTLDPGIFQISGMCIYWFSIAVQKVSLFLLEPFYDGFEDRDVPLFLPPWAFSKFDKPSNYA